MIVFPPAGVRRAVLSLACLASVGLSRAESAAPTEQEVKAAFLYQFTRFVEWPSAERSNGPEFVVAVLDADQFYGVAERTLAGKSARDLPVSVRRITGVGEAQSARILFVGVKDARLLPGILKAVEGSHVLTVGEAAGFAEHGGMIGFRTVDNRVRFDINVEQANRSGLKISSEVLKLARLVRTRESR